MPATTLLLESDFADAPSPARFLSYYEMSADVLAAPYTVHFLGQLQAKLGARLAAAGFSVDEAWQMMDSPDENGFLAARRDYAEVQDPLTGDKFHVRLQLRLRQVRNGSMMTMTTEATRAACASVVVPTEQFLFLSWDTMDLQEVHANFSKALAAMSRDITSVYSEDDFEVLPRKLSAALAP